MSIAIKCQTSAAPLAERRCARRLDRSQPLQALVEARMLKAQIEMGYSRPSTQVPRLTLARGTETYRVRRHRHIAPNA